MEGVDLEVRPQRCKGRCAKKALARKTGGPRLRSILEQVAARSDSICRR